MIPIKKNANKSAEKSAKRFFGGKTKSRYIYFFAAMFIPTVFMQRKLIKIFQLTSAMSFDVIFLSGRTHSDVPGAFKEMVEWLQKLEGGIDHYQHIAHSYIL